MIVKTQKFVLNILFLIFMLSLACLFACSDINNSGRSYSLRLNKTSLVVDILSLDERLYAETRQDGVLISDAVVVWKSSDESIVKIDSNGKITPVGTGNTVITVTWQDKKATCIVDVRRNTVPILTVNPESLGFIYGVSEPFKLETKVYYKGNYLDTSDLVFLYTLPANQNVVSVDSEGVVTPNQVGSTVLTVSAEYKGYNSLGMMVKVPINVYKDIEMHITPTGYQEENIYLNNFSYEGQDYKNNLQFSYLIKTPNTSGEFIIDANAEVKWKTSDNSVAYIDGNGKLFALKSGKVKVWYEYIYDSQTYYSSEVDININKYLLIDKTDAITLYAKSADIADSPFIAEKIFGKGFDGEIIGVYYNNDNIMSDGVVNYQSFSDGDYIVTVENSKHYAYKVNFALISNVEKLKVKPVGFYLYNNDKTDRGYGELTYNQVVGGKTAYITGTKSTNVANSGAFFCQYKFDINVDTIQRWINAGYNYISTEIFINAPSCTSISAAMLNEDISKRDLEVNKWVELKIYLTEFKKYVSLSGVPYLCKVWTKNVGEYSVSFTDFIVSSGDMGLPVSSGALFYSYNSNQADRGYGTTYLDKTFNGKVATIGGTKTTGETSGIFTALWNFVCSEDDMQTLINDGYKYLCFDLYLVAGSSVNVDLAYLSNGANRTSYKTGCWQKFYIDIEQFKTWLTESVSDSNHFFLRIWNMGVTGEYAIYISDLHFVKEK